MRLVKFALPLLFVAGLALAGARTWTDRADASARSLALEHSRHQFAQKAALVRAAANEQYRDELKGLLRIWFAEQADLANRWPLLRGEPLPFVPPAPKARSGELTEWQDLADSVVGTWREGRMELFQSAASQGLRLDLLRVTRVAGTQPHLAVDVAVWGAPEETFVEEASPGRVVHRTSVPLVFRGLSLRFFDGGGKLIARAAGEGEPALRLDVPARLVQDAPPGLVLGRYEPGLFPREAAEVEWTLAAQVRAGSNEARNAQAVFRTKVDPGWTLDAGQIWAEKAIEETVPAHVLAAPAVAAGRRADAKTIVWPERTEE